MYMCSSIVYTYFNMFPGTATLYNISLKNEKSVQSRKYFLILTAFYTLIPIYILIGFGELRKDTVNCMGRWPVKC